MLIYYGQELRTYLLGGRFEINSNSCYVSIACHHEMKGREHLKYRASWITNNICVKILLNFAGDVDFSGSPVDHTFMPNDATMICTNIAVFDDNLLEAVEFFSVDLSASDASVSIPRSTVLVIIQNSDSELRF